MSERAIREALADHLDFDVVGEPHRPGYPDTLLGFAEILRSCSPGDYLAVVLRRDRGNVDDATPIEVHIAAENSHVGFVPEALARHITPVLDAGGRLRASAVEVPVHPDSPDKPGLTVRLSSVPQA